MQFCGTLLRSHEEVVGELDRRLHLLPHITLNMSPEAVAYSPICLRITRASASLRLSRGRLLFRYNVIASPA